jgi:uncharacterized protein (UPF0335 family)
VRTNAQLQHSIKWTLLKKRNYAALCAAAKLARATLNLEQVIMAEKTTTNFAQGQLKALVERIERLEEEKRTIGSDIKEVYAEAAGNGFDVKILRKVISLRKKEPSERQEEESMLDLYLAAIGMLLWWPQKISKIL